MIKYKLHNNKENELSSISIVGTNLSIPFDPANTDYQNFKAQINADEAQFLDADGNLMTAEQAREFVATLP